MALARLAVEAGSVGAGRTPEGAPYVRFLRRRYTIVATAAALKSMNAAGSGTGVPAEYTTGPNPSTNVAASR